MTYEMTADCTSFLLYNRQNYLKYFIKDKIIQSKGLFICTTDNRKQQLAQPETIKTITRKNSTVQEKQDMKYSIHAYLTAEF